MTNFQPVSHFGINGLEQEELYKDYVLRHLNNLLQKDRRLRRVGATPQPRKINSPLITLGDGFDFTPPPTDLALNPLRANFHPPIRRIAADKVFIFGPSVSVTLWTDYHTPRIPRRKPSINICTNKSPIIWFSFQEERIISHI